MLLSILGGTLTKVSNRALGAMSLDLGEVGPNLPFHSIAKRVAVFTACDLDLGAGGYCKNKCTRSGLGAGKITIFYAELDLG